MGDDGHRDETVVTLYPKYKRNRRRKRTDCEEKEQKMEEEEEEEEMLDSTGHFSEDSDDDSTRRRRRRRRKNRREMPTQQQQQQQRRQATTKEINCLKSESTIATISGRVDQKEGIGGITPTRRSHSRSAAGPHGAAAEGSVVGSSSSRRRRRRCADCCKAFVAFLCSTVGLSCLMVGYVVLGGFVFQGLEAPNEKQMNGEMRETRQRHVQRLWELTETMNVLHPINWTQVAEEILENFTAVVYTFAKKKGWDGKVEDEELQWSFAGALLYSITVVTTIGYGHIAPKTDWGRVVTMLYAIVGIPLTLLTITNLGGFMATAFRFLYRNVCCGLCCLCCPPRPRRRALSRPAAVASSSTDHPTAVSPPTKKKRRLGGGGGRQFPVEGPSLRERLRRALSTDDLKTVTVPIYVSLLLITGYIAIGALLFTLWEKEWNYLIGCYFCFITLSTIGFGDYVPGTSLGAWNSQEKLVLCALYLLFGLALIAMCFDLMQEQARNIFKKIGQKLGLIDRQS